MTRRLASVGVWLGILVAQVLPGCGGSGMVDLTLPEGTPPAAIPLEAFFEDPELGDPKLSPSGRYVAGFAVVNGKRNVVKLDVETGARSAVTAFDENDLYDFWWASDERILFSAGFEGGLYRRLFSVRSDGTGLVDFAQRKDPKGAVPRAAEIAASDDIVSLLPGDETHVLVAYQYDPGFRSYASDVYKLNIETGRELLVAHSDHHPGTWVADPQGQVRLGFGSRAGRGYMIYRADENSDWIRIDADAGKAFDELSLVPIGFTEDPDWVYALARRDTDRFALYRYNVKPQEYSEPLFAHERVDVSSPLVYSTPRPGEPAHVIGVHYVDDFPRIHWLDERYDEVMARIDAALPDTVNTIVSTSADESRVLVFAGSDRDAGSYYLWEPQREKLTELTRVHRGLKPDSMVPVRRIAYPARDGLQISGYLALPPARDRGVPLIVNPHGGPWARDDASFDAELQFLASRGWAVFRPNFRGSEGFGLEFQSRGYKEWGLAMQDDITDGVRWLVEKGIADPQRICIYGASYGGFAALSGLVTTPELYRCGASFAGVSDLDELLADRSFYLEQEAFEQRLGKRRADRERLERVSPITGADRIRAPVLLAHGVEDRVVRAAQSLDMAKALERAGKPHHLLLLDGQPHGFVDEGARIRFYRNLEAFFARHLNGAPPSSGAPQPVQ